MSDQFLVVIPSDPLAELPPTAEVMRQALAGMARTGEARIKDYGKLQFIDAGQNAKNIRCSACDALVEPDQWHVWMQNDWHGEDGFHLHRHRLPCCGVELTLNDLRYDGPQGFSRWFVSARDNGRGALTLAELQTLSALAGLPLKAIQQRY